MAKKTPAREPTVDDFRLTEQQRDFHDRFCDGETKGNADASARGAGYAEGVARKTSFKWIPPAGTTAAMVRHLPPVAQAIFWTLERRRRVREEIEARTEEKMISDGVKRRVVTREYIEGVLLDIVERCSAKDFQKYNRTLGRRLARQVREGIVALGGKTDDAAIDQVIMDAFDEYASKHRVFRPGEAKDAAKLLGIEISMFQKTTRKPADTPVDLMDPAALMREQQRLEKEFSDLSAAIAKKGNGHGKPRAH